MKFWALVLATLALVGGSCSSGGEGGNAQSFCGLLSEGVGLTEGATTLAEFDRLDAVAPSEIQDTVTRLRDTALDLTEIDPLDVEAVFNAVFDPTAREAQTALEQYAIDICKLDLTSGPPVPVDEIAADLASYLDTNFGGAAWLDNLALTPGTTNARLNSVIARFVRPPTHAEEPAEVCRALSVYLYTLRDAQGTVSVEDGGRVVAFRSGPEASCITMG